VLDSGQKAKTVADRRKWLFLSVLALAFGAPAWASDSPARASDNKDASDAKVAIQPRANRANRAARDTGVPKTDIRVDSTLVLIPVTVTDPLNRFVTGLDKDNFRVFEDKREQTLVQFSSEDAPLSVGIVFDTSGSMGPKLQKSREAVAQFVKTANPEDEFFLVRFGDAAELAVPFTHDIAEIQSRLTFTQSKGRTALLDAIYMALQQMRKGKNPRKAVLVISDGGDNNSRYTENEIKNLVREADVQIYAIGIYEPMASRARTAEEMAGPGLLTDIAEQTGGRQYAVENLNELPDVAEPIVDLFAAETASLLAWALYLAGPQMAAVSPLIPARIRTDIDRRMLAPWLHPKYKHQYFLIRVLF
jgi:VWFA-related protein